jgi:hypothetical protein
VNETSQDSSEDSLPNGITFEQVQQAVDRSGYPLQTAVAKVLRDEFEVQPEWGFLDRITGEMRAIDVLATRMLYSELESNAKRIRPKLTIIAECKRSDLPYVFFTDDYGAFGRRIQIAGLHSNEIAVHTNDDRSTWALHVQEALGMGQHEFMTATSMCTTFSKCERRGGSSLQLSGMDAYHGLVMPIRSAAEHFIAVEQPKSTYHYLECTVIASVAILDAPMISATVGVDGRTKLTMTKWQRLWRHEPQFGTGSRPSGVPSAIDIVHVNFLNQYLRDHLLPFAETFAE